VSYESESCVSLGISTCHCHFIASCHQLCFSVAAHSTFTSHFTGFFFCCFSNTFTSQQLLSVHVCFQLTSCDKSWLQQGTTVAASVCLSVCLCGWVFSMTCMCTATARRTATVGRLLVVIVEGANLSTGEDGMFTHHLCCYFVVNFSKYNRLTPHVHRHFVCTYSNRIMLR